MQNTKDGSFFDKTTTVKDDNGKAVKIPGGFKIHEDSANNISDGIVITDGNGHQFVWIPVNSLNDLRSDNSYPKYNRIVGSSNFKPSIYNVTDWNKTEWSDLNDEFIVNAGGFYVGRFETGLENNKMVIKPGVGPYNTMSFDTALNQAAKIYKSETARTNLITGACWDTVMRFVHNKKAGDGHVYDVYKQNNRSRLYLY